MTGLNVEFAEPLQLCNYGIGGHFEPHLDFSMVRNHNKSIRIGSKGEVNYFDCLCHVKHKNYLADFID